MALSAVLVEATPYLLKYLLSSASGAISTSSPTVVGNLTIPNALGVTPDLATDALTGSVAGGRGVHTLQSIVNARRVGYQQIAAGAAVTQAQARALLASDDPTNAVNTTRNVMSCEMFITARRTNGQSIARQSRMAQVNTSTAPSHWNVDASIDASTNPVVLVKLDRISELAGASSGNQTAYLTIRCRHSYDW